MRVFSLTVLSLMAALGSVLCYLVLAPGDVSQRLIWTGLAFPVIWPLLMFYCYWPDSPRRPFILLGVAAAACGAILVFV